VVELAFAGELAIDHGPNQGAAPVGGNLSGSEARCRVDDDRYERHPDAGRPESLRGGGLKMVVREAHGVRARRHNGAVCSLEKLALLTDEAQPIGPIGGHGGVRDLEITQGMCG
jgi:hypothetical protein